MTRTSAQIRAAHRRSLAIGLAAMLAGVASIAHAEPRQPSRVKITTDATMSDAGNAGGIALSAPLRPVADGAFAFDLRGRDDTRGTSEFDLGTGYRHGFATGWDVGARTSIDRRQSTGAIPDHRADIGIDARRGTVALKAGAFASAAADDAALVDVTGTRLQLQTRWLSLSANRSLGPAGGTLDGEVGHAVGLFGPNSGVKLNLSAGAFQSVDAGTAAPVGQRGRVSLQADRLELLGRRSSLSMNGRIEDDAARDAQLAAELRLNIAM